VAIKAFEIDYGANYPKAVAKIVDHADVLLEFYRYPAGRVIHLRTTNRSRHAEAAKSVERVTSVGSTWMLRIGSEASGPIRTITS
jgi:transposase-like protein